MIQPGSWIGSIRIESHLGRGGMGEVWLGFDRKLERRVAVKTLHTGLRLGAELKARLSREARLLSRLGHPAICQIYDLVEGTEADYLILEYVEGETLRTLAERGLPQEEKLRLAEEIALALAVAHREQIVHRDLKADNIMVTASGAVKILDFGIARSLQESSPEPTRPAAAPSSSSSSSTQEAPRAESELSTPAEPDLPIVEATDWLTKRGSVLGTLRYMSPEQAQGEEVTVASDLFSFGILLQELFTGVPAYRPGPFHETVNRVARGQTEPLPELDGDLAALIRELLSLDPARRPTAPEAARRLRWIAGKPARVRRQRLRRRAAAAAFVFLLLVLAGVSILAVSAQRARREAERRRDQAENLIGFMLGDLRSRLEEVGRLDLLDAVGNKALEYFRSVPEEELTAAELTERIRTMRQIGEVLYLRGEGARAFEVLRQARADAIELVNRDPSRKEWQEICAEAHAWLGYLLGDSGVDPQESTDEMRASLAIYERLAQAEPLVKRWQRSLGAAHTDLGGMLVQNGEEEAALPELEPGLLIRRALVAAQPDDPQLTAELAATLAWLSSALEGTGNLEAAAERRRESYSLLTHLHERDPVNAATRFDVAVAASYLGHLERTRGRFNEGLARHREARDLFAALAATDSENVDWRRSMAIESLNVGNTFLEAGDPVAARHELEAACALFRALLEVESTRPELEQSAAACGLRLALAQEALGEIESAGGLLAKTQPVLDRLGAEQPENRRLVNFRSTAWLLSGRLALAAGDPAGAHATWMKARALLAPQVDETKDPRLLETWTRVLLHLEERDAARRVLARLDEMGYRSPSLEALAEQTFKQSSARGVAGQ